MSQRRTAAVRRYSKTRRSYTRLGIERLEDRCYLSIDPAPINWYLPFLSQANPAPTGVAVFFVEPVTTGSSVSWKPVLEVSAYSYGAPGANAEVALGVDNIAPNAEHIGVDQSAALGLKDANFAPATANAPPSLVEVTVGNESIAMSSPSPMDILAGVPSYAALGLGANSLLSGETPGLASLNNPNGGAAIYGGYIVLNASSDDPAMSAVVVNSSLSMLSDGLNPTTSAMVDNATTAIGVDGVVGTYGTATLAPPPAPDPSSGPATSLAPQITKPSSALATSSSALPNLVNSAPSLVSIPNVMDKNDDSEPVEKLSTSLSAPVAAVSAPPSGGSAASGSAAIHSEANGIGANPAGVTENSQRLVPLSTEAPAVPRRPSDPGRIEDGIINQGDDKAVDQARVEPGQASAAQATAAPASMPRSQAALLSNLPLDLAAIDRALENLLAEIGEVGIQWAGPWNAAPPPRWVILALAVAGAVGADQLRRRRLNRKSAYESVSEADAASWIFSSQQGLLLQGKRR